MKQVWISDDGTKQGTEEEVRAYEEALANPMRKLHLPWRRVSNHVRDANDNLRFLFREPWLTEFINEGLPLIEKTKQGWNKRWPEWRNYNGYTNADDATRDLLLLYERVLGVEPQ